MRCMRGAVQVRKRYHPFCTHHFSVPAIWRPHVFPGGRLPYTPPQHPSHMSVHPLQTLGTAWVKPRIVGDAFCMLCSDVCMLHLHLPSRAVAHDGERGSAHRGLDACRGMAVFRLLLRVLQPNVPPPAGTSSQQMHFGGTIMNATGMQSWNTTKVLAMTACGFTRGWSRDLMTFPSFLHSDLQCVCQYEKGLIAQGTCANKP